MWKLSLAAFSACTLFLFNEAQLAENAKKQIPAPIVQTNAASSAAPKVQLALLLDTSGSMDGLIEQAKAQLWKMVNLLAFSEKNGQTPIVEIALYEYGNQGGDAAKGWVRQVLPMGSDLDLLSQKLFELRTNGGEEYCAWAISDALDQLPWTSTPGDLRAVIIAGNEPFNQGPVAVKPVCDKAASKYIIVNTIFCGDYKEGVRTGWQDCPLASNGKYMNINTDAKVVHIPTPYDDQIGRLNGQLNSTYVGYGAQAAAKKDLQVAQESNAGSLGAANTRERAASKMSKSYRNESWDLVDAQNADSTFIKKVDKDELPAPMRNLKPEERKAFVDSLSNTRASIQRQIIALNDSANVYIAKQKITETGEQSLDKVMLDALREQATKNGFKVKE
jgi:hypothetical protein